MVLGRYLVGVLGLQLEAWIDSAPVSKPTPDIISPLLLTDEGPW